MHPMGSVRPSHCHWIHRLLCAAEIVNVGHVREPQTETSPNGQPVPRTPSPLVSPPSARQSQGQVGELRHRALAHDRADSDTSTAVMVRSSTPEERVALSCAGGSGAVHLEQKLGSHATCYGGIRLDCCAFFRRRGPSCSLTLTIRSKRQEG
jgi:hypothetical protein